MTPREYALVCFAEEAMEVAHAAMKVLRFTEHDSHTIGGPTNLDNLQKETNELFAMMDILDDFDIHLFADPMIIDRKKKRFEDYRAYSEKLGVIKDASAD